MHLQDQRASEAERGLTKNSAVALGTVNGVGNDTTTVTTNTPTKNTPAPLTSSWQSISSALELSMQFVLQAQGIQNGQQTPYCYARRYGQKMATIAYPITYSLPEGSLREKIRHRRTDWWSRTIKKIYQVCNRRRTLMAETDTWQ